MCYHSLMEIKSVIKRPDGNVVTVVYRDFDSIEELEDRKVSAVHAFCFCKGKLVIVYAANRDSWTPPGGGVDEGEGVIEAIYREIKEESNMKVLKHAFIGYQDISEPEQMLTQVRSVCIVEPYGDFIGDPDDGEITEIKLIDPAEYKDYFDWKEIGDHIVERAIELSKKLVV